MARGDPGDLERAFDDLEEALDSEPDLAPAHISRGNAYIARGSEGDLQLAATEFSRAIDLAPDSPVAYFNRGLVYSEMDDWVRSISDLRRAQELSPNDVTFNRVLCWQMAVTGSPQDALPFCDRAIAHDPSGQARGSRGLAYALTGRLRKGHRGVRGVPRVGGRVAEGKLPESLPTESGGMDRRAAVWR